MNSVSKTSFNDSPEDPEPYELTPEGQQILEAAQALRRRLAEFAQAEQKGVVSIESHNGKIGDMVSVMRKSGFDMLYIDDLLDELEDISERGCRAFELHFFAGLQPDLIAKLMQVPERLATRDVAVSKAWLLERLKQLADARG